MKREGIILQHFLLRCWGRHWHAWSLCYSENKGCWPSCYIQAKSTICSILSRIKTRSFSLLTATEYPCPTQSLLLLCKGFPTWCFFWQFCIRSLVLVGQGSLSALCPAAGCCSSGHRSQEPGSELQQDLSPIPSEHKPQKAPPTSLDVTAVRRDARCLPYRESLWRVRLFHRASHHEPAPPALHSCTPCWTILKAAIPALQKHPRRVSVATLTVWNKLLYTAALLQVRGFVWGIRTASGLSDSGTVSRHRSTPATHLEINS